MKNLKGWNSTTASIRKELKVPKNTTVLSIGDTHFPFTNHKQLNKIYSLVKEIKPNIVVQVGDIYDMHTFSRFARSVNFITPQEELEQGRKMAGEMWTKIHKLVPKARLYQLRGNHCCRIWKKIMAKLPEYESIVGDTIEKLFKFSHVETMPTERSELVINDIVYIHGWKVSIGAHVRWFSQSVVCGHSHKGGVYFQRMRNEPLFELNCGSIVNEDVAPLEYGETKTNSWIGGCGVIDQYGPRFISL